MANVPPDIQATYKGRHEIIGASHNEESTVYHVWTYRGMHDRWEMKGDKWERTDSHPHAGPFI
jgi:hypothetical protein